MSKKDKRGVYDIQAIVLQRIEGLNNRLDSIENELLQIKLQTDNSTNSKKDDLDFL